MMYYNNLLDNRERKVAIYARVSTEHEAQLYALENQKDWYKTILDNHPEWKVVGMYVDEGITGTSASKRPQFLKMIEDAEKGEFDLILTREVSRFARNTVDTLQYTRFLKSKKVEVYFINDNIKTFDGDGELRLTIMATLAQDESRKTSMRVKSGQQTSMNNGVFYGNGNILGYDRVGHDLVINPEQAKTVRMIYDLYLSGVGLKGIQIKLEQEGRLTSTGCKNWHCAVISKVLKNSFYCGIITYHKEYVPDFLEQKKVLNHGDIELTQVKGSHEPIVTEEEYELVLKLMANKREKAINLMANNPARGRNTPKNIWSDLLICECGHRFNKRIWHKYGHKTQYAYQCYGSKTTGTVKSRAKKGLSTEGICESPMVPEWKLQMMAKFISDDMIVNAEDIINDAIDLIEEYAHNWREDGEDNIPDEIHKLESEVNKLNNKLDNLIDMRSDGEITKEVFLDKQSVIQDKISLLNKEISELNNKLNHDDSIDGMKVINRIEELKEYLSKSLLIDKNMDIPDYILEGFVDKVVVNKDSFDWYLTYKDEPIKLGVEGRGEKHSKVSYLSATHHRQQLRWVGINPIKIRQIKINKSKAKTFLHLYSTNSKLLKWNDITLNIYI